MPTDEELMPDEETDDNGEQKTSWSERRKLKKQAKQISKTEALKEKIEQERVKTDLMKQRNELRQLRRESESPAVKNTREFAKELALTSSRSFGKTARYARDTGRANARRSVRRGGRRVQRIPAVMRQQANQPTGLEAGIMMEFQKPSRTDMFVGGQGNVIERGTQTINVVERGSQPTTIVERGTQTPTQQPPVLRTTQPVRVKQNQSQQQMDFFDSNRSSDFFGNQRDILGSQKKMDFGLGNKNYDLGLGKKKKQNYW